MNNKTDRCVPRQGVGGAWEVQVLSLSLWGTVIASPILFSLHLPCPSLQFIGGGRWRRQNRNTHLGSCCSFPILFIFCLFFFFLTKVKFYLLQSFPVITTKPAPSKRPNLLACSRSLCLFISSHDFAVSITLICPLDNSSLNISKRLFLREQ